MKVNAYLTFRGNCQEALRYYAGLFDAEITNTVTYENASRDIPSGYRGKLQHAELKGKNLHLMAYDAAPDTPLNQGNHVHLGVQVDDESVAKDLFNKLSGKGRVHQHFGPTDWGAKFGRCTDQYGIHWMINCK